MDIIMGKVKKSVGKAVGGGGGNEPKAPKISPQVAPTVQSGSSESQSQVNTGRRAQSILDPMMAKEDENKEILG